MNDGAQLPEDLCPNCGAGFNRHSQIAKHGDLPATPATPKPGDLTLCIHCAAVLTFDSGLRLAVAPAGAVDGLDTPTRFMLFRARALILAIASAPKGRH